MIIILAKEDPIPAASSQLVEGRSGQCRRTVRDLCRALVRELSGQHSTGSFQDSCALQRSDFQMRPSFVP